MKLTPKQEKFCQLYIELGNASEAYRQSYSAGKMKPEAVHVQAARLQDNPKIALRIIELQAEHAQRHRVTVDDLLVELEEARRAALSAETVQASAAVTATMGKAKLLGFDKQIVEVAGKNGGPIQTETITMAEVLKARQELLDGEEY